MSIRHRLDRLERQRRKEGPAGALELWLPYKPDGKAPGRYLDPWTGTVTVIYNVEELTDAELVELIGLGPNPTDEQLQAVIDARTTGTEGREQTP